MKNQFLETGKIINTHGVRGEVKIEPWCDSPDFLCKIKTLYINSSPVKVLSSKVHGKFVIAKLDGCEDIDTAIKLKNKIIYFNRDDVKLPKGSYFLSDLIGLDALDYISGEKIGILSDILEKPAGNIYVIKAEREILVPANKEFVKEVNIDGGFVKFSLIEGM